MARPQSINSSPLSFASYLFLLSLTLASTWKTPFRKPNLSKVSDKDDFRRSISASGRIDGMIVDVSAKEDAEDEDVKDDGEADPDEEPLGTCEGRGISAEEGKS